MTTRLGCKKGLCALLGANFAPNFAPNLLYYLVSSRQESCGSLSTVLQNGSSYGLKLPFFPLRRLNKKCYNGCGAPLGGAETLKKYDIKRLFTSWWDGRVRGRASALGRARLGLVRNRCLQLPLGCIQGGSCCPGRVVERERARWHDPVLGRWLGLTPEQPALCLRGFPRRPRAAPSRASDPPGLGRR